MENFRLTAMTISSLGLCRVLAIPELQYLPPQSTETPTKSRLLYLLQCPLFTAQAIYRYRGENRGHTSMSFLLCWLLVTQILKLVCGFPPVIYVCIY